MTRLPNVSTASLPLPRAHVIAARPELVDAVAGRVSTDDIDRLSYARDMWPQALLWIRQGRIPPPPDAVVWPGSEHEVSRVITLARKRKLAVIPYGGGSGVCGGTWAIAGGVTLDLKRLDSIGEVDAAQGVVEVGAGVFGETLERRLNSSGWTLGHFPSSIATSTVGGWLATRSAGQFSSKYGKIEDIVLSARGVLGTGESFETPRRPFSGPDLKPLLLGSEGTLCAFTGACLRVFPVPPGRVFHGFQFSSLPQGLEAIRLLFREGLRPAVVRLYDPFDTALSGKGGGTHASPRPPSERGLFQTTVLPALLRQLTRRTLGRPAFLNQLQRTLSASRLILMFEGTAARAEAEDRAAAALCGQLGATDLGEGPGRAWFKTRYDVSFKMSRLIESGSFADTMEVAAPWEYVQDVYDRVRAVASPFALVMCHFSHAYVDGCSLYFSFVGSADSEGQMQERYEHLWRSALAAAVSAGANVSHHHGIGLLKAQALQDSLGEGRHALRALKRAFDPDGVMNPGKLGL